MRATGATGSVCVRRGATLISSRLACPSCRSGGARATQAAAPPAWRRTIARTQACRSALIVLCHAQEYGSHFGRLRCPRVLNADSGQLNEIVFHVSSLCAPLPSPCRFRAHWTLAQRVDRSCDADHRTSLSSFRAARSCKSLSGDAHLGRRGAHLGVDIVLELGEVLLEHADELARGVVEGSFVLPRL